MSLTLGLVGNPNSGKTTVFNVLTGARQQVGNWPGVTVERKSGLLKGESAIEVIDLPGTYSLTSAADSAIDERIACEYILTQQAQLIINIVDANNLERNLYLTTQLIEMKVPLIVAVNMMDVARARRTQIDIKKLADELGCPVIALEANKAKGIKELKQTALKALKTLTPSTKKINYPSTVQTAIDELTTHLLTHYQDKTMNCSWLAMRLLEQDAFAQSLVSPEDLSKATLLQQHIGTTTEEDADILLADARYHFIQDIVTHCVEKNSAAISTWTSRIDSVVLNRWLGIPLFLSIMYSLFLFAINIGGAFQDFFDIGSDTLFVGGFSQLLTSIGMPNGLTVFLANGVGKGINTTLTFVPVIGAMFLALAFLEDSGYMARAAFVVDRLMRLLGLPGKSFVPMIVGFGCNVPAVMGARTLENKRDRILTVMMSPFMSCGARLAIYAVFVAAFFPVGGQNIVFSLYLLGILMAVLTGVLLRKTLLQGASAPLVMELPPYHLPQLRPLFLNAWQRLKGFVYRAGKLIVPICIVIGALNSLNLDGSMNSGEGDAHSVLSTVGQWLTPIFMPMGITSDNWPATVGLLTGVLAKEVVIGTLNTLYSQLGHMALSVDTFSFWGGIREAFASIPANLSQIGHSLGNPVLAKAPIHTLSQPVYGLMYQRFDGQIGAMAYLLFVLLYFPCISTTAVMIRELSRGWAWFSVVWTSLVAYGVAVGFYQLATCTRHPLASFLWLLGIASVFFIVGIGMRLISSQTFSGGKYEFARN